MYPDPTSAWAVGPASAGPQFPCISIRGRVQCLLKVLAGKSEGPVQASLSERCRGFSGLNSRISGEQSGSAPKPLRGTMGHPEVVERCTMKAQGHSRSWRGPAIRQAPVSPVPRFGPATTVRPSHLSQPVSGALVMPFAHRTSQGPLPLEEVGAGEGSAACLLRSCGHRGRLRRPPCRAECSTFHRTRQLQGASGSCRARAGSQAWPGS